MLGRDAADRHRRKAALRAQRDEAVNADGRRCVRFGCRREHRSYAHVIGARRFGPNRGADDESRWCNAAHGGRGHVLGAYVNAGGAARQRDVRAVIHDNRDGKGGDERSTDVDERSGVGAFQPQLNDRRAASRRGQRARDEPFAAVTQIVGDRDQREIDRFASLCSENVSLNS